MSLASSEDKLCASEADMRQLRASMREYEVLVDEYRQQVRVIYFFTDSYFICFLKLESSLPQVLEKISV